jgi:hypothetical protein
MIGTMLISFICSTWPMTLTVATDQRSTPDTLAKPVRQLLEEKAIVVSDGDTEIMCIWFRTSIPSKATAEQVKNGLTFRELPETVIVGAVKLAKPFIDYRKQEIPAGVYTLRLGFQPENGDHTGTAPHAEFLLLSPASEDRTIDEMDLKAVVAMSKKATGSDHPSVMLLFPYRGEKDGPAIEAKEGGVKVLQMKRAIDVNGKTTLLGFGITVAGVSKTR